jgi:L-alanine-DL-glutamate epimerase-like enolase superfamily enzyme
MTSRPAVVVRAEDVDGVVGWGETWCNWPTFGAEHRAQVIQELAAPQLLAREWSSPTEAFRHLTRALHVLAIQTGEPGPIAQAIAGIDIALWDLAARRLELPLWRLLREMAPTDEPPRPAMPVYASGLNPHQPESVAAGKYDEGYRAFKLKVGFDAEGDLANLAALRERLGDAVRLMIDANQAWDLGSAFEMAGRVAPFQLFWLEEPLPADSPEGDWQALAETSAVPLAGGENLASEEAFAHALGLGALAVVQPDIAKWGGFSRCLPLARRIIDAGRLYCPHYLGGGIGLVASAHLLAAAGGAGMLEVDANDNPLRQGLAEPFPEIVGGEMRLSNAPGLGIAPAEAIERYRVDLA